MEHSTHGLVARKIFFAGSTDAQLCEMPLAKAAKQIELMQLAPERVEIAIRCAELDVFSVREQGDLCLKGDPFELAAVAIAWSYETVNHCDRLLTDASRLVWRSLFDYEIAAYPSDAKPDDPDLAVWFGDQWYYAKDETDDEGIGDTQIKICTRGDEDSGDLDRVPITVQHAASWSRVEHQAHVEYLSRTLKEHKEHVEHEQVLAERKRVARELVKAWIVSHHGVSMDMIEPVLSLDVSGSIDDILCTMDVPAHTIIKWRMSKITDQIHDLQHWTASTDFMVFDRAGRHLEDFAHLGDALRLARVQHLRELSTMASALLGSDQTEETLEEQVERAR